MNDNKAQRASAHVLEQGNHQNGVAASAIWKKGPVGGGVNPGEAPRRT